MTGPDDEPPDDFVDRVEAAMAAIDDELTRVGTDWDALDAALLGESAGDGADDDDAVMGVDVVTLVEVLRTLPDGAGLAAVLAALEPPAD